MKKYILGFLTIILFVSITCGCGTKKKQTIVGKWTLQEIQGGPVTIVFGSDNSLQYSNANYQNTGTYKIEKNIVTFIDVWDDEVKYEYEIKDEKLSLNGLDKKTLSYPNLERVK